MNPARHAVRLLLAGTQAHEQPIGAAINFNAFENNQSSLALFVYQQAGDASRYAPARAWTAALTLVALVLILTIAAKLLARRNQLTR